MSETIAAAGAVRALVQTFFHLHPDEAALALAELSVQEALGLLAMLWLIRGRIFKEMSNPIGSLASLTLQGTYAGWDGSLNGASSQNTSTKCLSLSQKK